MKTFSITLKHDKGTTILRLKAKSQMDAELTVMRAESCPRSAIVKTVRILDITCPHCQHYVWDTATADQRLNKCHNCGLRFDSSEE